jgi:hypothetical protein
MLRDLDTFAGNEKTEQEDLGFEKARQKLSFF